MMMDARPANATPTPQKNTRSKERCQPRRPVPREREDDSLELGSEGINIHVASPKDHYKNGARSGPPIKGRSRTLRLVPISTPPWLPVWQVRASVFTNGSQGAKRKNPLRDKD